MEDFPTKHEAKSGKKRRNKYARELQEKKYRQKVKPSKRRKRDLRDDRRLDVDDDWSD